MKSNSLIIVRQQLRDIHFTTLLCCFICFSMEVDTVFLLDLLGSENNTQTTITFPTNPVFSYVNMLGNCHQMLSVDGRRRWMKD